MDGWMELCAPELAVQCFGLKHLRPRCKMTQETESNMQGVGSSSKRLVQKIDVMLQV